MTLTFEAFVAKLQLFAEVEGMTEPGTPYRTPEEWRDAYSRGLTPEEAWLEEMSDDDEESA